jgi:class 3 adenylate cyclase/tetratricopeptide (TPR) repeat protein
MQCPRCQVENPPETRFCGQCAASLAAVCTSCGASNPGDNKFCGQCAGPLGRPAEPRFSSPESYTPKHLAEKILTSKRALEGERKQVTVLFADLKGSMELLADRDPEEARKLLDPVLERMMEAVHRYEGTVNQVMGDGIMALFGAPLAHEDHAVRACYAALRMQQSVRAYADEVFRTHGLPVQIRIGLNSGEVVVRTIGSDLRMDYTAVGQTTHLAARMEQLATPGTILLTPETLKLAEGYVSVAARGPVPVKGLSDPLDVYEMTGVGPARTRLQVATTGRGLTRFVGREAELEQLRRSLELAAKGRGQVAALVGEAGVGKSRLFYELTHSHRTHGWLVLESGAASYAKAASYLPVSDLLRAYFKIGDPDNQREIREKVTGKLLALDRALEPTLPAVLSLLDVPTDDLTWESLEPRERRQRTLDAVKRLLLHESRVQPLAVVFEDLHWIDAETQAVLDAVVESLPAARVLLLVNYRPEYGHGWGSKTYYSQLRLDALPPETADDLLRGLLGVDPALEPLKRMLTARTEGNPLFLEESVRALVETGVLAGERGAHRLAKPVEAIEVPATVQAMLAARIDRLPSEEKALLQAASAVGKDVPLELLRAVADLGEQDLPRLLARLTAAEFLYETSLFPDPEYSFKHALTHEVAYGSLLRERRRGLHAQIVEAIERLHAERLPEHVERLAHHALRGEVWAKALAYLRQAGLRAIARSAHREAIANLEEALAAMRHLAESRETTVLAVDLRLELAFALAQSARYADILQRMREAEPLAESLDDRIRLCQVLLRMSQALRLTGDYGDALRVGHRAVAVADELGDPFLRSGTRHRLGQIYFSVGEYPRAVELLRGSVDLLGELAGIGDELGYVRGVGPHAWLGYGLAFLGEFKEAILLGRQALRLAESGARPGDLIVALGALGSIYLAKGDHHEVVPVLERGLALCRSWGILDWSPTITSGLAAAYAREGRLAEAIALHQRAAEEEARGTQGTPTTGVLRLAETYLVADRVDDARACAERALSLSRTAGERSSEARALRLLGEVDARGDSSGVDRSERHFREALTRSEELSLRPLVAHCHLGLGTLYRRSGKRMRAQEHLTTATTLYREMDMRFWLEKAEAEKTLTAAPPTESQPTTGD